MGFVDGDASFLKRGVFDQCVALDVWSFPESVRQSSPPFSQPFFSPHTDCSLLYCHESILFCRRQGLP